MTAARLRTSTVVVVVLAGAIGVCACKGTPKQRDLPWVHDEAVAFERARAERKGVMVNFAATWCAPCEELERTFVETNVYKAITSKFVPLKLDVTEDTDADHETKARYDSMALPSVVFVSADRVVLGRVRQLITADELEVVVRAATQRLAGTTPANVKLERIPEARPALRTRPK